MRSHQREINQEMELIRAELNNIREKSIKQQESIHMVQEETQRCLGQVIK